MATKTSEYKLIKEGEEGRGLLIENDGFMSLSQGFDGAILREDERDGKGDGLKCPYPFIVPAVFQKFGIKNANGRIYPENVLKPEVEKFQEVIKERRALMEANHPDESIIDLSRVAGNIVELHWEGSTLLGKLEIITSEGFRKYGIISCCGDEIANLLLQGLKIGVSSRGIGNVEQKYGIMTVTDYELVTWDIVSQPSTPGAWITDKESDLKPYVENYSRKGQQLIENAQKFSNWLNRK